MMNYPMICPECDSPRDGCVIRDDGTYTIKTDRMFIETQSGAVAGDLRGRTIGCMACGVVSPHAAWFEKATGKEMDEVSDWNPGCDEEGRQ